MAKYVQKQTVFALLVLVPVTGPLIAKMIPPGTVPSVPISRRRQFNVSFRNHTVTGIRCAPTGISGNRPDYDTYKNIIKMQYFS